MDSYGTPQLPWLLRVLSASFPVGRILGVQVRIYWLGLVLLPLIMFPTAGLSFLPAPTRWGYVVGGMFILYFTIWLHEMGHIWAGRRYHIQTPLITISPLGGLAHMDSAAPSPRGEIWIALAGPLTHLAQLALWWPWAQWFPPESDLGILLLHTVLGLNVVLLGFNLLPCYPMDGGRVLRGLLAMRVHPNRATLWAANVGIVGAIAMIVWSFVGRDGLGSLGGGLLIAIAVTNILACLRARLEARFSEGPYGEPRQAWEQDADAWKHGALEEEAPRKRSRPARPPTPEGDAELDRLLDRVRQVGLAGLTAREREALRQASEARRRGP
jgi:Zn-dependent protease